MSARILEGTAIADEIKADLAQWSNQLSSSMRPVRLVAVQAGQCSASKIYTNMQSQACAQVGIEYQLLELAADVSQHQLIETIKGLNADPSVSGIILQMPLPEHVKPKDVQITIAPQKDVEGMHPQNLGRLFYGKHFVAPCTALAAVELIKIACDDDLAGKEAVVIGHSEIVGKPIATLLLQSRTNVPTVTVCHAATRDLGFHTRRADILVVAAGAAQAKYRKFNTAKKAGQNPATPNLDPLISADMIKPGAIVIDVAINRIPTGFDAQGDPLKNEKGKIAFKTVGDVDFDNALKHAAVITPVPGGVGPLTVAMLLKNTLICAEAQRK